MPMWAVVAFAGVVACDAETVQVVAASPRRPYPRESLDPLPPPGTPHKIFVSTDLSLCAEGVHEVDDGFALVWLMAQSQIDLVGIGVTHGNVGSEGGAACAAKLVEMTGKQIPVYSGASGTGVNGANGAAEAMVAAANEYGDELWIVTQGTTTDLAAAAQLDPTLPSRVGGALVMAAAVSDVSGVMPFDPVNALGDMESLDFVLRTFPRLTVAPLDLTEDLVLNRAEWSTLRESERKAVLFLHDRSRQWVDLQEPFTGGFYPFDAIGLAPLLYPDLLTESARAPLAADFSSLGRMRVASNEFRPRADIWLSIDRARFVFLFLRDLGVPEASILAAMSTGCGEPVLGSHGCGR